MKTERQQDQDVAERLRRDNLERANATKDNEVDEKVMPVAWVERTEGGLTRMWSGDLSAWAHRPANPEPLYSADTVAELRARADAAERRVGELEAFVTAVRTECFDYYNEGIRPWPHHMQTLAWKADEVLEHATLTGADPT